MALDQDWVHWVAEIKEFVVEGKGRIVASRTDVDDPTAAEAQLDEQLLLRPHPQLAGRDTHRLVGRVGGGDTGWDLTNHSRRSRVLDIDNEDARMHMGAGPVRIGGRQHRSDGTRAVGITTRVRAVAAVANVGVVLEERERGVHAAAEEGIVADQGEVAGGTWCASSR